MAPTVGADRTFGNVADVASWCLCIVCAACAYAYPEGKVELGDFADQGCGPYCRMVHVEAASARTCLAVCPDIDVFHGEPVVANGELTQLAQRWGSVLEVWEGLPADPDMRFNGSSAGMASARAVFCIEQLGPSRTAIPGLPAALDLAAYTVRAQASFPWWELHGES